MVAKKFKTIQALFRNEKRWIKGANARTYDKKLCAPTSPDAFFFCLNGAFKLVYPEPTRHKPRKRLSVVLETLFPQYKNNVINFNDSSRTTIADIHKAVRKARI